MMPIPESLRDGMMRNGLTPPPMLKEDGITRFPGVGKGPHNWAAWAKPLPDGAVHYGDESCDLSETYQPMREQPQVSVTDARSVEPEVPEPDRLARQELRRAHEKAMHKQDRGWIGVLCGSRAEKAGNVAFMVILGAFILIACTLATNGLSEQFFKLFSALLGVVGLALRYLFGSKH